jgi:spore coat polysaccharide biosynthesis protein SpsF (cytidylyltransferase family)
MTIPVALTTTARQALVRLKGDAGTAQQDIVARVLEWLAKQDPEVQSAILHRRGDPVEILIRLREEQAGGADTVENLLEKARAAITSAQRNLKGRRGEKRQG